MGKIYLYAQLTDIAYTDLSYGDVALRSRLTRLGYDLQATYDTRGTQGYVATRHGQVVVAFPGTADKRDFFTDMKYIKTDFPLGGRVHLGFYHAYLNVADAVSSDLRKHRGPLTFIGHSLGAAIALIAASTYPERIPLVRTFGCPRVGNKEFALLVGYADVVRYENWFDAVTFVPPKTSPWQAYHSWKHDRPVTLYTHRGTKVGLSGVGHSMEDYLLAARKAEA